MINMWISHPSVHIPEEEVLRMFDLDKYCSPVQESSVGVTMVKQREPELEDKAAHLNKRKKNLLQERGVGENIEAERESLVTLTNDPLNHPLPCSLGSPSTYALQCYLALLCLLHLHLQLVPLLQSNHLHLGDKFNC